MKVPTTRGTAKPLHLLPCAWTLSQRSVQSLLPHFFQVSVQVSPPAQRPQGFPWPSSLPCSALPPQLALVVFPELLPPSHPSMDWGFTWASLGCWLPPGRKQGLVSLYAHTYYGASRRINTQGAFAERRNLWLAQSILACLLSSIYVHTHTHTHVHICLCFFRIKWTHTLPLAMYIVCSWKHSIYRYWFED